MGAEMVGRTSLSATAEQREALAGLARSAHRAEADRARAILWSLERRTGEEIGGRVGVTANTVRKWRVGFRDHGVDGLRARPHPGRAPWKSPAALRVANEVLAEPVVNGANWTLPRLRRVIAERTGVEISKSRLSVVLRKKGASSAAARATRCAAARTRQRSSAPGGA